MFAALADECINDINISKDFYLLQYDRVQLTSQEGIKRNFFGAMIHYYLSAKALNATEFLESDLGKMLEKLAYKAIEYEEINSVREIKYKIKIDKNLVNENDNELNLSKAVVEFEKFIQMKEMHDNNAIISLLIKFENFLTEYFKWLVGKYPEKYLNDKSIKYSDLVKYDYESMKEELINESANALMSSTFNEWIRIIRAHKYDLSNVEEYIHKFKEIYYRRNLIVHNRGKVNRIYLDNINKAATDLKLGDKLNVDKDYVIQAYRISMILVYGILYASLKSEKEDRDDYLALLFDNGFEHMMKEDWVISKFIYEILMKDKKQDDYTINVSKVNYWISCKNNGEFDKVKKEIENTDFSSMLPSLQMAKAIILERYDEAVLLMDQAIPEYLYPEVVKDWPLFIQFRKTHYYDEFLKKYENQLEEQHLEEKNMDNTIDALKNENVQELELLFKM